MTDAQKMDIGIDKASDAGDQSSICLRIGIYAHIVPDPFASHLIETLQRAEEYEECQRQCVAAQQHTIKMMDKTHGLVKALEEIVSELKYDQSNGNFAIEYAEKALAAFGEKA